jgi:hypothetical protein
VGMLTAPGQAGGDERRGCGPVTAISTRDVRSAGVNGPLRKRLPA